MPGQSVTSVKCSINMGSTPISFLVIILPQVYFGGVRKSEACTGEERFLSLSVYPLAFTGEIGNVIVSGCHNELPDSQWLNPCRWQVRVLMTGDRTPSGVCLCQISCSSKTAFSPTVTLRWSTFGGNRRTNVKQKLRPSRLTMHFAVLSLDLVLEPETWREDHPGLCVYYQTRNETVIGSVRGVPFKKEIMYRPTPPPMALQGQRSSGRVSTAVR